MRAIGCRLSAAGCDDDSHLAANQIGCQQRQSIWLPLSVTIFNRNISAFDEATLAQALIKRGQELCICICRPDAQKPITGIAGCCARAASGHVVAAAAPPSGVMISRRPIIRSPRRRGRAAPAAR
jgi:hypothetical protein